MSARHPPRCQRTATASKRTCTIGLAISAARSPGRRPASPTNPTRGAMPTPSPPPRAAITPGWTEQSRRAFRRPEAEAKPCSAKAPSPNGAATTARGPSAATRRSLTSILTLRTPRRIPTATAETWPASCRRVMPGTLPARGRASTTRRPSTTPAAPTCATSGSTSARGWLGTTCSGFMVLGTTNVDRIGANPNSAVTSAFPRPAGTRSSTRSPRKLASSRC